MTHNRLGHRFQRRLDVPNWLEPKGVGAEYANKVLATQSANLIAYWPFSEAAGIVADNLEGTAARDAEYDGGPTLGQPGIGDGRTCPQFDAVDDNVDIYTASLDAAFDGAEGTLAIWARVSGAGVWTDGVNRTVVQIFSPGFSSLMLLEKRAVASTFRWDYNAEGTLERIQNFAMATTDWFHLALTWSASADEMKAYLNGAQEGVTQVGLGVWDPANLLAGQCNIGLSSWEYRLAHPAMWTIPLTGAEVLDLATL